MKHLYIAVLCFCVASVGIAAPRSYQLDTQASQVGFEWDFGNDRLSGKMPVTSAEIVIDFDDLKSSTVRVELDSANAQAGFAFATQAMRGPKVLDSTSHPRILFVSNRVRKVGRGAQIDGTIRIRGVEKAITLDVQIYRQEGTSAGDRSRLTLHLNGAVMRSAFGATGWSDMVGDRVGLKIVAHIRQVK